MKNQQKMVIESLKKILKSKGWTYEKLAKELKLSLPSIKRILAKEDMSLSRLETICDVIGIQMTDVFRLVETVYEGVPEELSMEQEVYFSRWPARFAYLDLLLNGMSVKQIETQFKLSKAHTAKVLRDLEKIGVIDWLSDYKVKLKISPVLKIREKGPLRALFADQGIKSFLAGEFSKTHDFQEFMTINISDKTKKKIITHIKKVLSEAAREGEFENQTGVNTENAAIYVALRNWKTADAFGL